MDKKKLITAILVPVFTFIYSFSLVCVGMHLGKKSPPQTLSSIEEYYVVKEHDNKIVVFRGSSTVPMKVLSIDINTLRKQDLQRFREGITVKTQSELAELEEDFLN